MNLGIIILLCALPSIKSENDPEKRIVGGTAANISAFPYQVALLSFYEHKCGGSIVDPTFIITAAHCVLGEAAKHLRIRAGSRYSYKGGVTRRVCKIFTHSYFNKLTLDYDIAVLKLCNPLVFGTEIRPILLPISTEVFSQNSTASVTGYGVSQEGAMVSTYLQKISVKAVDRRTCKRSYKNQEIITKRMICAVCKDGLCDSCQGDSGGPLAMNSRLIGITSFGYGCAHPNFPGVYTKVSYFRRWIQNVINNK